LVPTVQALLSYGVGTSFAAITEVSGWAWTHRRASVLNAASLTGIWVWTMPEYFESSKQLESGLFLVIRYALPLMAFVAPFVALRRHKKAAGWFAFLAAVLIFCCKGVHPPFAGVSEWMYAKLPGYFLFREPISKFGPLLILCYAALIGMSSQGFFARSGSIVSAVNGRLRTGIAVALALCALTFSFPVFTGTVVPGDRPESLPSARVEVPSEWHRLAADLNANPARGKVLNLPLADFYQMPTTWGFYGVDNIVRNTVERPVIISLPGGYLGEAEEFRTILEGVDNALRTGDLDRARSGLQVLGVSQVVLRKDYANFAGRTFASPASYEQALTAIDPRPLQYGVADVFEVAEDANTLVAASSSPGVRADVSWKEKNPSTYDVTFNAPVKDATINLRESYADGWKLSGLPSGIKAEHVRADGYANAWRISGVASGTVTLHYGPSDWGRAAIKLSLSAIAVCLLLGALRYRALRRRAVRISR